MADFSTVKVADPVIGDVTDKLIFGVKSGAASSTYQTFPVTSPSNSSLVWQVSVPSENVVVDRRVLMRSGMTITLYVDNLAGNLVVGSRVFEYGLTDSWASFPLHKSFVTQTVGINNCSISVNTKDVLPALLRLNDSRELYRFNSMTCSMPDQAYGKYSDSIRATNSPLASFNTGSYDLDQVPRGAFPAVVECLQYTAAGVYVNASNVVATATNTFRITVSSIFTEPIFVAPFIWTDSEYNNQGLLGINTMSMNCVTDGTLSRVWSSGTSNITRVVAGATGLNSIFAANPSLYTCQFPIASMNSGLAQPSMLFRFLSSQPTDMLKTRNVCPWLDYPRYIQSQGVTAIAGGASAVLTSSNIQLSSIPDRLVICVRKQMSSQTVQDPDMWLACTGLSVNFNNSSGLLSSASISDLYAISRKGGSSQSFGEFCGQQWSTSVGGQYGNIATTGSLIVLQPAFDFGLPTYLSSSSLGSFNLQFTISVFNQLAVPVNAEICVIAIQGGLIVSQQGLTTTYQGLLSRATTLEAMVSKDSDVESARSLDRLTGGGRMFMGARHRITGGAMTGGAYSGGAASGGRSRLESLC